MKLEYSELESEIYRLEKMNGKKRCKAHNHLVEFVPCAHMSEHKCERCGKPATHRKVWGFGNGGLGNYIRVFYCEEHYTFDSNNEIDSGCFVHGLIPSGN